jgi:hypothetical protein
LDTKPDTTALVWPTADELIEHVARRVVEILREQEPESADEWLDVQGAADYLKCGKRDASLVLVVRLRLRSPA